MGDNIDACFMVKQPEKKEGTQNTSANARPSELQTHEKIRLADHPEALSYLELNQLLGREVV